MKNIISIIITLCVSLCAFGQKSIDNKLTDRHLNVTGTKVSLIPPKDFTQALNFLGFQHDQSGSSIMILDIPGPYSRTSEALTEENLRSQGVESAAIEKLTLNGLPALFVSGKQSAYGLEFAKFILVFGTEKETIMINGASPGDSDSISNQVKEAMLSVYYEAGKKTDPFEAVDYSIDVSATKLKFGKSVANSLVYSVDGKVPTQSNDKTSLITSKSHSEIARTATKDFSINRLKQLPIEIEEIKSVNEISIDGISGYEIYATGRNKSTREFENIYQVILFTDNLYYILFGTTNDKSDVSIAEIKKAIITFKRK